MSHFYLSSRQPSLEEFLFIVMSACTLEIPAEKNFS
jgi:hypothetical protein